MIFKLFDSLDKNIKIMLELSAFLISLAGVFVFFIGEYNTIAIILSIVTAIALLWGIFLFFLPNYKILKQKWRIKIMDDKGAEAKATKSRLLKVYKKNQKTLIDRNFTASGTYESISCNLGEIHGPFDEGGSQMVTTVLKTELSTKVNIEQVLSMKILDSFTAEKENMSTIIDNITEIVELEINFPESRPAISATGFRFRRDIAYPLDINISDEGLRISLIHNKVKIGDKYVLEWTW